LEGKIGPRGGGREGGERKKQRGRERESGKERGGKGTPENRANARGRGKQLARGNGL